MSLAVLQRSSLHMVLLSLACLCWPTLRADVTSADLALQAGRASQAQQLLTQSLAATPSDAKAHQLLCRLYYAEDMADAAISECLQAVARAPSDSDDQMWLGRAYGLKASEANPFSALQLAKSVHAAFERSVQLNPRNVPALSDLGEFYVGAPSVLGGGLDKAEALAKQMDPVSPAAGYRLLALVATARSDIHSAEMNFKAAVNAGHSPEAYVDLAHFYEQHERPEDAVAQVQAAIAADRRKDAALVDAASILISAKRRPDLAENLLRAYLNSDAKSDAAPAFQVHVKLGKLLKKQSDTTGARREFAAALALAPDYVPAQKAARSL